jgi:hypothetical protein
MGIAESIALLSLVATVAGGAWSSFRALDSHLGELKADIEVISWRIQHLEAQNQKRGDS